MRLGGVLAAVTEALLPGLCPHCDRPLAGSDRGLCGACWAMVLPRVGAACARCGGPVDDPSQPCLDCLRSAPPQRATVVWGEHDGALRTAIVALKHHGRDDLAEPLAARLAAAIATTPWASSVELVTWVPSHLLRKFRRPFTAARLLAYEVARQLGVPRRPLLVKRGLGRQVTRSRSRRLQLPGGALAGRRAANGCRVLLVDDVTTTGTTLRRAAEAVLATGATAVYCAALAATPDPRRIP